ncbi:ankyrin repeat-containing domain protein [Talaromyces proteolyticus]|uniref:Ankyrin repeat-containing domain protein n=1 Tax=Talaromyces proteolyticus TaxID=1131652 RepID=A0AAD4KES0_9EURO|nr:ankyrin repeat-containing domain protein [Talaromyces proteolyticus]KAH8689939.1 ankyrin repeat-containing domain protein [Talaromyces proteolyticus]
MDPLSVTASLIAVIQITTVVCGHCMQYVRSAKNSKTLILGLVQRLGGLQIVLATLEELTKRDSTEASDNNVDSIGKECFLPTLHRIRDMEDLFKECLQKLEQLETDISPPKHQNLSKREALLKALHWPIKEAYMKKIMEDITEYISLFSFALTLDETNNVLDIRQKTTETNTLVRSLHEQKREEIKNRRGDEIARWLSAPDSSVDYMHALRTKAQNTGNWLIQEQRYKEWKLHPNTFWLNGTPGSGKTVLSSTVLEDLLGHRATNMNIAVIYFYFKADDATKRTPEGMLRSLLKQIFDCGGKNSEVMIELFGDGNKQRSTSQLLSAFMNMTSEFCNVYVVLDALDECQDLSDLFDMIEEINKEADENLHIFFTSRDTKYIKECIENMGKIVTSIKLTTSVVKQDIRNYIRDRLRTDRDFKRWRGQSEVQKLIEDSLIEKSDGMFLWVVCQLKELRRCRGPPDLRRKLATMPKDLNETYAQMLSHISDDDYVVAMRMLYWLLFSTRPLHIEELAELVAMDFNIEPFDKIEHIWDPNEVLDICPGLMTTIEERSPGTEEEPRIVVRLAHISIQEYLLSNDILNGQVVRFHIEKSAAHASITECCLMYMRLIRGNFRDVVDSLPLAVYAADNWLYHYEQVPVSATKIHHLTLKFLLNMEDVYLRWIRYFLTVVATPKASPELYDLLTQSPLYVASSFGLLSVLKLMLDSKEIDWKRGPMLQNALRAAYMIGLRPKDKVSADIVELLVKYGADFRGDVRFPTNLHAGGYFGLEELVKKDLDSGIDVNIQGGAFGTALQAAAVGRGLLNFFTTLPMGGGYRKFDGISLNAIQVLLERGADPNISGDQEGSALFTSCLNGDLPCAKLLLDYGADTNYKPSKTKFYKSCLSAASRNGGVPMVQLLFEHGADMNCTGALGAAAGVGDGNLIRFLLQKGADPRLADRYGDRTPLQQACASRCPDGVEALLQYGADPNEGGGRLESPFQEACVAGGPVDTLRLLIDKGVDLNKVEGPFGTCLHTAAFCRHTEIFEYLLQRGANVHIKGKMFPTVLRHAFQNPQPQIFTHLLKLGDDMDTPAGRYGETLQQTLAAAPADKSELRFDRARNPQEFTRIIRKGDSWQDFDQIVIEECLKQEGVAISDLYCILPD